MTTKHNKTTHLTTINPAQPVWASARKKFTHSHRLCCWQ